MELAERLRANRARARLPEFSQALAGIIGYEPRSDDFLAPDATAKLRDRTLDRLRSGDFRRRTWSTDLRDELMACLADLAEALDGERAFLLHQEDVVIGAVLVPVKPMLEHAVRKFGTWGQEDLWMAQGAGESGLRLAWDHLPTGDEYELVVWGRFAVR